jgi:hypothetical protein
VGLNGGVEDARGFTPSQRAGLDARAVDQDRTLVAVHQLEAALAAAAPGRESRWREGVIAGLVALDEATSDEFENVESPDSLLSDVKRTQPRLRTRVRGLRMQYVRLREAIVSLRAELDESDEDTDFADVRERLSWVLTALRHQRARESDLIYEAYFDAFNIDLGEDEGPVDDDGPGAAH